MIKWVCAGLVLPLSTLALLFGAIAISVPFSVEHSLREHQKAFADFRSAAAFVDVYRKRVGANPPETIMRRWASEAGRSDYASQIQVDGDLPGGVWRVGCAQDNTFHPSHTDQFVLSYWNGDFFECYGFPSERTTLVTSRSALWAGGSATAVIAIFAAASLLAALAGVWCLIQVVRRFRSATMLRAA